MSTGNLLCILAGLQGVAAADDASCLPHGRQGAAAVTWRDSVLIVAGSYAPRCNVPTANMSHFEDILIGPSWEHFASLGDENRRTHHGACVSGDMLFVLGGYGTAEPYPRGALDSVLALDLLAPADGPVQKKALPTGPMTNFGVAAIPGSEYLIIAGGFSYATQPAQPVAGAWKYSIADDAWTELAPMQSARGGFGMTSVQAPQLIFAIGGFRYGSSGSEPMTDVEVYDVSAGHWRAGTPLPSPRATVVAVAADDGRIVVAGGDNATADICYEGLSILERDVVVTDGLQAGTDNWSVLSQVPTVRGYMFNAIVGNELYTMGGFNGTIDSSTVEILNLREATWQGCEYPHFGAALV